MLETTGGTCASSFATRASSAVIRASVIGLPVVPVSRVCTPCLCSAACAASPLLITPPLAVKLLKILELVHQIENLFASRTCHKCNVLQNLHHSRRFVDQRKVRYGNFCNNKKSPRSEEHSSTPQSIR